MFKFSYNSNGLRYISPREAIKEVALYGYDAIELSLDQVWLKYNTITKDDTNALIKTAAEHLVEFSALATGADDLLSIIPYEPSLIHYKKGGRKQRVKLIKKAVKISRMLGIKRLNFASGKLYSDISRDEAMTYLVEGIKECLKHDHDITLMIEPEPGMFIETTKQAITLINEIRDERLRLNLDVGHVICCEDNYIEKIRQACRFTEHVHMEDIKDKTHRHLIPGKGSADIKGILKVLMEEGYNNFISVELYEDAYIYKTALRESIDYLKKMIFEINNEEKRKVGC